MAQELGMSYQDLSNMAIAAAERTSAASELMASGVSVDDKEKEFITNLSRMGKDGRMVIEIPQSIADSLGLKERDIALENLDQSMVDSILANQKAFEQMDVKDIAMQQFTETQQLALRVSEIAAMLKVEFAKTYRGMGAEMDKYVKSANEMLDKYITGDRSQQDLVNEIDTYRKDLQKKVSDDQKTKVEPKKNEALPVNNSQNNQQNTNQNQQQSPPISKDDLENMYRNLYTSIKNDNSNRKPEHVIVSTYEPGSYLS